MQALVMIGVLLFFVVNPSSWGHSMPHQETPTEKTVVTAQPKIDLNKAGLSELVGSFKGIGKKRAAAIIAYRESHHGFKSIEELAEVKGLGQHFVSANRDKLNELFMVN